jgi:hypothetical protein
MSSVEHREAERRVKAVLVSSMVGLLMGLIVATLIASERQPAPPGHSGSALDDESNGRKDAGHFPTAREVEQHA